jgi:hypothetical protein
MCLSPVFATEARVLASCVQLACLLVPLSRNRGSPPGSSCNWGSPAPENTRIIVQLRLRGQYPPSRNSGSPRADRIVQLRPCAGRLVYPPRFLALLHSDYQRITTDGVNGQHRAEGGVLSRALAPQERPRQDGPRVHHRGLRRGHGADPSPEVVEAAPQVAQEGVPGAQHPRPGERLEAT